MAPIKSYSSVYSFLFSILRTHWVPCGIAACISVANGFLEAFAPYTLKMLVDPLVTFSGDPSVASIYVWWPALLLLVVIAVKHITHRFQHLLIQGYIIPQVSSDIRFSMLSYATGHSFRFYQDILPGIVGDKITLMVNAFEGLYESWEHSVFPTLVSFVLSIFLISQTNVMLSIVIAVWFVTSLVITFFLARAAGPYAHEYADSRADLVGNMINILQNIFTVKMFARNGYELQRLKKFQQREITATTHLHWMLTLVRLALSLFCIVLLGGVVWILFENWKCGTITVGDITFVVTTSLNMINTIWWMSSDLTRMQKYSGIAEQAYAVMRQKHEITDAPDAKRLHVSQGAIEFNDISFAYPSDAVVFKNLSLSIAPGEKIGLVGFSGSGKTTLINLLMRFFEPQSGTIAVDGQDISQVTQDSLHRYIALIPQDTTLFSRSVTENIAYANQHASQKEIEVAAQKAKIHKAILRLPEQYETVVGERGAKLSGGQRQRVAIARAILMNAPILVLDEATSALDSITEKEIQESLDELMQDRTTIVIAHRLSTLQNMDRIIVFDRGRIVEEGSHQKLVRKRGYYSRLWKMQVGGAIPRNEEDQTVLS